LAARCLGPRQADSRMGDSHLTVGIWARRLTLDLR
jgi:hypothetical protein